MKQRFYDYCQAEGKETLLQEFDAEKNSGVNLTQFSHASHQLLCGAVSGATVGKLRYTPAPAAVAVPTAPDASPGREKTTWSPNGLTWQHSGPRKTA